MQAAGVPVTRRQTAHRAAVPCGGLVRVLGLVAWIGVLCLSLAGAVALGGVPALATPPITDPGDLAAWASAREPVAAAFAVLRIVVVAVSCYLLLVTLLAVVLRLGRAGRLVTAVDVLTLPFVRHLVHGALGVGLVGASLAAVGSAAAGPGGSRSLTGGDLRLAAAVSAVDGGGRALPADEGPAPPTMHRLDPPAPAQAPAASAPAPAGTEVTVEAGDHLWAVAERALTGVLGRPPDDAQLAPYWEQVVEANRARLADPANPDLLFPGQTVLVPPPGPATLG